MSCVHLVTLLIGAISTEPCSFVLRVFCTKAQRIDSCFLADEELKREDNQMNTVHLNQGLTGLHKRVRLGMHCKVE